MKKKKKSLYAIAFVILFGVIGTTIAYYSTNNTFENEFNAGTYIINTQEVFESPDNWQPGDSTPKKITVKNEGEISAAVKVCFRQKWEDKNGNPLPLHDDTFEFAAILEFDPDYDLYWKEDCSNDYEEKYCFYYYKELAPDATTEPLLDSVIFNEYFPMESVTTCTEDPVTHTKTCTSTMNGYSGGKYTLYVDIETVQYNLYNSAWNHPQVYSGSGCDSLNIITSRYYNNMLGISDNYYEFIGSNFDAQDFTRERFESVKILDNMNIPDNAIESWDVSFAHNGTVMAWYTDNDNDGEYELFVGANGKVIANPYSNYLFYDFYNVKEIDVTNLDTSRVLDMTYMFGFVGRGSSTLNIIGLDTWDTSNVKRMFGIFDSTGGYGLTLDFSNWDVSNVNELGFCDVFNHTLFTHTGTEDWPIMNNCK